MTFPKLSVPDENVNIYMLPMGGGDSTILQCPTGKLTLINLGKIYSKSYWNENDVEKFLGSISQVETIIITRPHPSLYNLLPILFEETNSIKEVYIACTAGHYAENTQMAKWLDKLREQDKVTEVKSKSTGTPACLGDDCTKLSLCSDSPFFESKILAANLAGCSSNPQEMKSNSIVLQLKFYDFNMLMPGDLEDPSIEATKFSKQVILSVSDPEDLQATVYQAASHGTWGRANKYFLLNEVKPQYVVVGNTVPGNNMTEFTPRCELLYYLAHREGGSLLNLASTQSFQCIWSDETVGRIDETNRALFLTAFDNEGYKVRRVLQISSDGEKHKVSHLQVPMG